MPLPALSPATHAVLAVHRDQVLWIESTARGGLAWSSARVASEELAAVVAAALSARAAAQGRAREVVLTLGGTWAALRFLALPELSGKELRAVLQRKACSTLGLAHGEALYAAARAMPGVPHGARELSAAPGADPSERWLLAAAQRGRLEVLRDELLAAGLRVRRAVPARLATLPAAGSDSVVLFAQRDPDGVALSLCARSTLLQQGALPGGSEDALATALLQEARSHAAFARRALRGEAASELVLLGFEVATADQLERELVSGLGLGRLRRSDGGEALARALFDGALRAGPWCLDLLPARRPSPRRAALWCTTALALTLSLSALTSRELQRQRQELGGELRELQRQAGLEERGAAVAHGLAGRIDALERELEGLEGARAAARRHGDDLEALADALSGEVRIQTLELDRNGVRLDGLADARPLIALAALERVRRRLARGAGFTEVELRPAGPGLRASEPGQPFVIAARRTP